MPQMMPINWLMIFLMCLTCLFITIILMNALLLYMKMKDINNNELDDVANNMEKIINNKINNDINNSNNNNKNNNKKNNSNSKKKKKWEWSW